MLINPSRLTSLLLLLICFSHLAIGQGRQYLKRLSVSDGLNQSTVNTVIKDSKGYLWIGTGSGINIYDGNRVWSLPGIDGELERHEIYQIREDAQGKIWFTASGQGLYSYHPQSDSYQHILRNDPADEELPIYLSFAQESGEKIWLLSNKTIGSFTPETGKYERVVDLRPQLQGYDYIYTMKQYGNLLLIGTRVGLFSYQIDSKTLKQIPLPKQGSFNASEAHKVFDLEVLNESLYLGSNDGLFSIGWNELYSFVVGERDNVNVTLEKKSLAVWDLIADDDLLISTEQGLLRYNSDSKTLNVEIEYSKVFDDIGNNTVTTLFIDNDGIYWMGSQASGLFYANSLGRLVRSFGQGNGNQSLTDNVITGLVADENTLWASTTNGLNALDLETNKINHYLSKGESWESTKISEIIEMAQYKNLLFLSTYSGLKLFDKLTRKLTGFPFSKKVNDILSEDELYYITITGKNLWLVSEKEAFVLDLEKGSIETIHGLKDVLSLNSIWKILPDFDGDENKLLLSTNDELWSYDRREKELEVVKKFKDVPDNEEIYIDSYVLAQDGQLWIAYTGVGVVSMSMDSLEGQRLFNRENSGINNSVYGITTDKFANVWFSSNDGLYRIDAKSKDIKKFSMVDGLVGGEFNSGAFTKLNDGRLAYGGMRGLSIFDPLEIDLQSNVDTFNVRITSVSSMSSEIDFSPLNVGSATINLDYSDVGIKVDFSAFAFLHADSVKYRYELKGENGVNSEFSYDNSITFSRLAPGDYQLTVFAISPFNGNVVSSEPLRIYVKHAPWASPVAIALYWLVGGVLIVGVLLNRYQRRAELLKAHEHVKASESTLKLALAGSNSEVWDWTSRDNRVFQKRVSEDLKVVAENTSISMDEHISLIHQDDREKYVSAWSSFVNSSDDKGFSCTYRMHQKEGAWLWYRDLGKIVERDEAGHAIRVTGSYTNITQSIVDEERAKHYGDAFKQTKDWVFMLDSKFKKVTVNPSLKELFCFDKEEFDFDTKILGVPRERYGFYLDVLNSLKHDEKHWSGEELITTPKGDKYHVLISISKSSSQTGSMHYIFVMTDVSSLKDAENKLRTMANYDDLTALPNRSLLLDRIKHGIQKASRKKESIALMFVDLDRFKSVNDSLGHYYGDLLLKEVAKRLSSTLREDDTVARIGGDEFVVLVEQFKSNGNLSHIAQKIINALELPFNIQDHVVSIGASIGISVYPNDSSDQETLLRNADVAMYNAKQNGRNGYRFFEQQMNEEAQYRLFIEQGLKFALKNDEFYCLYQPLISAETSNIVGVEMLMRWNKSGQVVSPCEFIPIAEELGLIKAMTDKVLDKALKNLVAWRSIKNNFALAINISAPHFADSSLVDYVSRKLKQYNIPPSAIKLEVTEGAFIGDPERAVKTMQELSELGVKLALDDFGTGYSSLAYLKKLPLDILKIDRSFISGIGTEKADEAIIDATLVLAESLNVVCVAEGVETRDQLDYLLAKNCTLIQGYYYYPPIEAEKISQLLKLKCVAEA